MAERAAASSVNNVFERLLAGIVTGRYPAARHLPAERELARTVGASRPTLREATSRLAEWRLIEVRHGSGVMVRPPSEWSFDVLPAYLRFGGTALGPQGLARILADLLSMRRALIVDLYELTAGRVGRGALDGVRQTVERAWASRDQLGQFLREDFEIQRGLLHAANFLPPLWLLNSIAQPYFSLAEMLAGTAPLPAEYRRVYQRAFDAVERGNGRAAARIMDGYFATYDRKLRAALGF
ncbi:MAG: FadR/GntR family transcriptional regulator [Polyangia bacterium]